MAWARHAMCELPLQSLCLQWLDMGGSVGTAPLMLNPGTCWRWLVSFMCRLVYLWGKLEGILAIRSYESGRGVRTCAECYHVRLPTCTSLNFDLLEGSVLECCQDVQCFSFLYSLLISPSEIVPVPLTSAVCPNYQPPVCNQVAYR
jgi:hypothetical protein